MIINNRKIEDRSNGLMQDQYAEQYKGSAHVHSRHISFYDEAPKDVIGIYEFQNIAVSRLQVLKKIEFLYASNKENNHDIMAAEINQYSKQHKLNVEGIFDPNKKTFGRINQKHLNDATKNDNISHFICRLAYCRNDDLRRWFAT